MQLHMDSVTHICIWKYRCVFFIWMGLLFFYKRSKRKMVKLYCASTDERYLSYEETGDMTLISESNNWALLSIMFCSSFMAIYLEQKYKWASKSRGSLCQMGRRYQ